MAHTYIVRFCSDELYQLFPVGKSAREEMKLLGDKSLEDEDMRSVTIFHSKARIFMISTNSMCPKIREDGKYWTLGVRS